MRIVERNRTGYSVNREHANRPIIRMFGKNADFHHAGLYDSGLPSFVRPIILLLIYKCRNRSVI